MSGVPHATHRPWVEGGLDDVLSRPEHMTLARDGDLRAFTPMAIDGDVEVIVPQRDGGRDAELWKLHLEMVEQAQEARAETIETVLFAISGLIRV